MIIETENLKKVYRTDVVETTAVDSINFTLKEGEFVSIMGPSGCGKSTLLHILGLIDSPSDGAYRFLGENVARHAESQRAKIRKAHIGFVFQSFNLIDELTVYENVELPLVYANTPHSERKGRVEAVLEKMDIAHRRDHFPAQLSGGQQQRVAVARALVNKPNLILADEPTGNLDSEHGDEVMKLLLKLNEEGTTILMVTHSPANAQFSSRVVSLLDGRIVSDKSQGAEMRNYIMVLFRNLKRERLYTAINILGLALGIACCLILGLFLKSELTYDKHYKGHENLYRIVNEFTTNGTNDKFAATSPALGPMLMADYPDVIKAYVRFQNNANNGGVALRNGDQVFYWEHSYFVDPNVFDVFPPDVIYGDPKTALRDGGNIAISQTVARRYFGDENPVGKTLATDSGNAQKIALVFRDLPVNTHMKYDILFSNNLPYLRLSDNASVRRQQLTGIGIYTYAVLDPTFKTSGWKRINDEFTAKYMADTLKTVNATWRSWLQPIAETHLQSEVQDPQHPGGNRMYLYGCAAVALIILVIACINYMNLATARATRRARSIGIRKILGASRTMLALQFLGEAILFALLALVLAAVIVEVVLKFTPINTLMQQQVSFDLINQPMLALLLLGLAVLIGLLSGLYPALYLSSWAPLTALTGRYQAGKGNLRMREALVLLQFTISATAIATTLLMMSQMDYIANAPLGFEKHNRLVVTMRSVATIEKAPAIRNELLRDSHIHAVAFNAFIPGKSGTPVNLGQFENEDGSMAPQQFNNFPIGENFEKVMGLKVAQGRDLSSRLLTDVGSNLIVNETLVKKMGWSNPLGKRIQIRGENGRVVGVVKDFNFKSLHTTIEPAVMYRLNMDFSRMAEINKPFVQNYLILDIAPDNIGKTLSYIEKVMGDADPKHAFEYTFLDASLEELYRNETGLTRLIGIFAAVSIFIACLGLFGLSTFTTEQRTREIGTRKVLGATSWQIVRLLARPIMILVVVASVLAAVASYFAIDEWLTSFAYRAGINPLIFVLALLVAGTVAFVTVALQSWKTASADPVNSLRHV